MSNDRPLPFTIHNNHRCELCHGTGTAKGLFSVDGKPLPPDKCPTCNGQGIFSAAIIPSDHARAMVEALEKLAKMVMAYGECWDADDRDEYINPRDLAASVLRKIRGDGK